MTTDTPPPTSTTPATPPQSDPALATAEAIEYHNPDKLHSAGEPPWRFLVNGEGPEHGDQWRRKDTAWREMPPICNFYPTNTYRTRRPLPHSPAPAPEGRGETAETPETDAAELSLIRNQPGLDEKRVMAAFDFARRLERQRDEARLALTASQAVFSEITASLTRERDAAVAQAQALREGLTRLVAFKFELFEDGLSADLHDEGIEGASAGYLRGIQDACDELKTIAAAALAASEAGK